MKIYMLHAFGEGVNLKLELGVIDKLGILCKNGLPCFRLNNWKNIKTSFKSQTFSLIWYWTEISGGRVPVAAIFDLRAQVYIYCVIDMYFCKELSFVGRPTKTSWSPPPPPPPQ